MNLPLTDLLLAHRAAGTLIENLHPDLVPNDKAVAHVVQTETIRAIGPIGAWKVSPVPANGEPAASPLPTSAVYQSGAMLDLVRTRNVGVEAEIAVTISRDLAAKSTPYTLDDVLDAVGGLHLAIEIIDSRFADRVATPALAQAADLLNGAAVIVGPERSAQSWPELERQRLRLLVDGVEAEVTTEGSTTANALAALVWLANHATSRGLPLMAGTVIITGARIGALPLTGRHLLLEGDGFEPVSACVV